MHNLRHEQKLGSKNIRSICSSHIVAMLEKTTTSTFAFLLSYLGIYMKLTVRSLSIDTLNVENVYEFNETQGIS